MKKIQGDLIALAQAGNFDVIVHGCNCFNTMGAGIAAVIKKNFPEAAAADEATKEADRGKLGTFSYVDTKTKSGKALTIVNAYTQYDYRGPSNLNYDALKHVFRAIRETYTGKHIAYPAIGAGLGGGDWTRISAIIENELAGEEHTFVEFKG